MSSSEPILDLKTELEAALPAHSNPEEQEQSHGTSPGGGDNLAASNMSSPGEPSPAPEPDGTLPSGAPQLEAEDPSPTNSLPWPEAPEEECPAHPTTLDFSKSLKKLEEVKQTGQRRNSEHVKENGVEVTPVVGTVSEERRILETELGKCIEDFRRIKIPLTFPNKKRQWQSELLKKYHL
ncbi:BTB/POZ domain-containing protein KCTD8-like [Heliangelus exortis]|uniref:BTB/POZ domain-containing protein KCTD8-like n=1 Tax=Heliangelus exortis TaxID=472823 RepID=UPI003A95407B